MIPISEWNDRLSPSVLIGAFLSINKTKGMTSYKRLFDYANGLINNEKEADQIVTTTMGELVDKWEKGTVWQGEAWNWALTTIRHKCYDYLGEAYNQQPISLGD